MDGGAAEAFEASAEEPAEVSAPAQDRWPLTERPGFLIRRLQQIHGSLFAEQCAAFRITPLQYSLLSLLTEREAADYTTLAHAVALDRTTTTGALKRLEARGLILRETLPSDRRSQLCRVSDEGRALHAAMEGTAREAHEATVAALDDEERDIFIRLMKKITAAHDERRGGAGMG